MRSENSVCHHCTRRTATCHATCPDGKAEEERNRARRESIIKRRAGNYSLHDSYRVNLAVREKIRKDHWNY